LPLASGRWGTFSSLALQRKSTVLQRCRHDSVLLAPAASRTLCCPSLAPWLPCSFASPEPAWSGQGQELRTAKKAVQEAAPGAVVEDEVIEDTCGKSIFVAILKLEGGKSTELYRTDQRNLFSKYADKRTKSIAEIKAAVAAALK